MSGKKAADVVVANAVTRRVNHRNLLLVALSYAFYACWDARFLALLLLSTAVDYACGLALSRVAEPRQRRGILAISIASNLAILGAFKYLGFFADNLALLLSSVGIELDTGTLHWALPVGISFYTFQTLGYTIDVYRGRVAAETNLVKFAAFVAFFPQLVAGPIERGSRFLPQLNKIPAWSWQRWNTGWYLVGLGLFKKVALADNLSVVVGEVYGATGAGVSALDVYVGAFAFLAQLYLDLSAYTDIARGSAKLLGFELMVNFRMPYLCRSPLDFWARWHVSMSTWFRDYLYAPLAGRRHRAHRVRSALLLTMVATGFWHGAGWTFVVFGLVHGVWMIVALELRRWRLRHGWPLPAPGLSLRGLVGWLVFMHGLAWSGILFRADSLGQFGSLSSSLVAGLGGARVLDAHSLIMTALGFLACLAFQWFEERRVDDFPALRVPPIRRALLYVALALVLLALSTFGAQEFVYVRF